MKRKNLIKLLILLSGMLLCTEKLLQSQSFYSVNETNIRMRYGIDMMKKYETDTLFVYKNCPSLRLLSIVHSNALSRKFMNDKQTL